MRRGSGIPEGKINTVATGAGWAYVPEWAAVAGEHLHFSPMGSVGHANPFTPPEDVLWGFLAGIKGGRIEDVAMRFGILGLFPGRECKEPLWAWIGLAVVLQFTVEVGQQWKETRGGRDTDVTRGAAKKAAQAMEHLAAAFEDRPPRVVPPNSTGAHLADVCTALGQLAGLHPVVNPATLALELHGSRSDLLAHVVVELMAWLGDSRITGVCAGCGNFRPLKRRPTATRRAYCQTCGKRAAWRAASRKSYVPRQR